MAILDRLRESLHDATTAATGYPIVQSQIEGRHETINRLPTERRNGYLLGGAHRGIIDIAATHHTECRRPGCGTCAAISTTLTTVLASLQTLVADEELALESAAPPGPGRPHGPCASA